MKTVFLILGFVLIATILSLYAWRWLDHRQDRAEMNRLLGRQPPKPVAFGQAMVAALPPTARRYFEYVIQPGAPVLPVARISMVGKFGMGDVSDPKYMDMQAEQILAGPRGFVWKAKMRQGPLRMSGSDSGSWTRFWIAGLFPVARFGGHWTINALPLLVV